MAQEKHNNPSYIKSLLLHKCPKCRHGDMFINKNSYSKNFMLMNDTCSVCAHPLSLEPDFYYGTGYVSNVLAFAELVYFLGIQYTQMKIFGMQPSLCTLEVTSLK